jgi:hypothetical protein
MNHNWERIYYETYAKLSLIDLVPEKFSSTLTIMDKPDLQDPEEGVGVEVTRAMFGDAGKETGLSTMTKDDSGTGDGPIQTGIARCQYQLYGGSTVSYTKRAALISDRELLLSFQKKLVKLNNDDFRKYRENDLYIFSPMFNIFGSGSMERFTIKAAEAQLSFGFRFDYVYVNDFASLFICDLHSGKATAIDVSEENQRSLCLMSKRRADKLTNNKKTDI